MSPAARGGPMRGAVPPTPNERSIQWQSEVDPRKYPAS